MALERAEDDEEIGMMALSSEYGENKGAGLAFKLGLKYN